MVHTYYTYGTVEDNELELACAPSRYRTVRTEHLHS